MFYSKFPPSPQDAIVSHINVQGFRCGYGSYARVGIQFQSLCAYPIGFILLDCYNMLQSSMHHLMEHVTGLLDS